MNALIILFLSFIVSIRPERVRTVQEDANNLELLSDEEIRDLELQDKEHHDMIVNQAFRNGYERDRDHDFIPPVTSGSKMGIDTERIISAWNDKAFDGYMKHNERDQTTGTNALKLQINPDLKKSTCLNSGEKGEESKQIKIVVSASGIPDFASSLMKRQKRSVDAPRQANVYMTEPQYEVYKRQPQQQRFPQFQQQGAQDTSPSFNPSSDINPSSNVHYGEATNGEDLGPVLNTPRQLSPKTFGQNRHSNEQEDDSPSPKYEFNYDIPKDSFQSDVINGQFSTFAKLPMSFESLIQSDASFLDSLSEQPPENVDRSVLRNNKNYASTPYRKSPTGDSRMEQISNLRAANTDDSDYDSENFEPTQRPPTSQMQIPYPNQYMPQNQQYYSPQKNQQQQQKLMHQLPVSPSPSPPVRQNELPVYVNGANEPSQGDYEYVDLKQHVNQRHNLPTLNYHQNQIPAKRPPVMKGLIRQASQAFRQPYKGLMQRSSSDNFQTDDLRSRILPEQRPNRREDNFDHHRNYASEQRVKDMRMMYYTTTPPPPPPPQKVVNAQLNIVKNGVATMPVLPKQLSINYISGPPPPPPPPTKDPYGMDPYTTAPPPPPPPPPLPSYYGRGRRPPTMYDKIMDQMWEKYTTTPPPPPPPSKIIQFGLNFSQTMDDPVFVKAPKQFISTKNSNRRMERSVGGSQQEIRMEADVQGNTRIIGDDDDVCEESTLNGISSFCPSDSKYPKELMLQAWDGRKIDEMLEQKKNDGVLGMVNREHGTGSGSTGRNDSVSECVSTEQTMRPLKAKNTNGLWKVIVNLEDKLRQEITALSCKTLESSCSSQERSSIGSCGQRYQLKDLITFDVESKSFQVDSFDVPSGCICLSQFSLQLW